jgi:hypothetical protein
MFKSKFNPISSFKFINKDIMKVITYLSKLFLFVVFLLFSTAFKEVVITKSNVQLGSEKDSIFSAHIKKIYDSCQLNTKGMTLEVFEKGMTGFYNLKNRGLVKKSILSIVDFQKSSTTKRLWVIDLKKSKVLFHTLVAHGKNTGEDQAIKFSDIPNSYMSSLGFYQTRETYIGKHGLSLVLDGLDKGFNSNAKDRSIVMHGAEYVCEEFIQSNGRLGRSQGCPAVPPNEHKAIIQAVEGGSILYVYYPTSSYRSIYLNRQFAIDQFLKENKG